MRQEAKAKAKRKRNGVNERNMCDIMIAIPLRTQKKKRNANQKPAHFIALICIWLGAFTTLNMNHCIHDKFAWKQAIDREIEREGGKKHQQQ